MRVTSRHGVDVHPDPCKREACSMTLRIYSLGEPGEPGHKIYISPGDRAYINTPGAPGLHVHTHIYMLTARKVMEEKEREKREALGGKGQVNCML